MTNPQLCLQVLWEDCRPQMGDYLCGLMVLMEGVDGAEGSREDMDGDYFYRFLVSGLCSLITERCLGWKHFELEAQ